MWTRDRGEPGVVGREGLMQRVPGTDVRVLTGVPRSGRTLTSTLTLTEAIGGLGADKRQGGIYPSTEPLRLFY